MKITSVTATPEPAPPRRAIIRDALQVLEGGGTVRVKVETSEGVTGSSAISFGRIKAAPGVLAKFIMDELTPQIIGDDPFLVRGVRDKLWRFTEYHGSFGLGLFGIAAIDIALWDLMGKATGLPVWRLLGAQRDKVPAYAMVGWLNWGLDELKAISVKAIEQGFQGVKVKVGSPTLEEDVQRIEAVRSAIGPGPKVMVDANQVFTVAEALRRGRVYQELGCFWFEEPVKADDIDGLAHLSSRLDIPIASGENQYGKRQFRDLFEKRAVDIVQPDLRRAGGVTECFEVGVMADAFNIPYASHGGGVHLHVLAALPNTIFMESSLLPEDGSVQLVNGCYPLPEAPGFG
jgi:L-alanine-DL-glutamate epimerase-like enolase superfamily enzyme